MVPCQKCLLPCNQLALTKGNIMKANKEYCPVTQKRVHEYFDMEYWNNENHPTCGLCWFVDTTRTLDIYPIKDNWKPIDH